MRSLVTVVMREYEVPFSLWDSDLGELGNNRMRGVGY